MSYLLATPKAGEDFPKGPPVRIRIGKKGEVLLECDDLETYEWMQTLLTRRMLMPGLGYPKLRRGKDGALVRNPTTKRFDLEGYVEPGAAAPAQVLGAIRDNLEATEQFELQLREDGPSA